MGGGQEAPGGGAPEGERRVMQTHTRLCTPSGPAAGVTRLPAIPACALSLNRRGVHCVRCHGGAVPDRGCVPATPTPPPAPRVGSSRGGWAISAFFARIWPRRPLP